jgi:4-hydroxy-tetrahydrodipicolinate synthase
MIVPLMSLGGKGVISVVANILPKETHDLCQFFLNGKVAESRKIQLDLKPFIDSLFIEVNPIPIKKAMNLAGYGVGGYRLPLYEMAEANVELLKAEMAKLNLLKG